LDLPDRRAIVRESRSDVPVKAAHENGLRAVLVKLMERVAQVGGGDPLILA
jgi:hypothetical protein